MNLRTRHYIAIIALAGIGLFSLSISFGKSHDKEAVELPSFEDSASAIYRFTFEQQLNQFPKSSIPVHALSQQDLKNLPNDKISAVRLGHSSVLIKLGGKYWLTDPVFSESLGPFYSSSTKRLHPVPIPTKDLPPIKGVLISHNHYDHLDKQTIKDINPKVEKFFVPLGNAEILQDWGVDTHKIHELDWWQAHQQDNFRVIATPANHLSGRVLVDQNTTLWSSWVLQYQDQKIYFSGDTGYSDVFKEIGNRYGPFDLTLMENGSYDKSWKREHLSPEETLQAHLDLNGQVMMPIHNCTFDLAFHPWNQPLEALSKLALSSGTPISIPEMGKPVTLENSIQSFNPNAIRPWWRE